MAGEADRGRQGRAIASDRQEVWSSCHEDGWRRGGEEGKRNEGGGWYNPHDISCPSPTPATLATSDEITPRGVKPTEGPPPPSSRVRLFPKKKNVTNAPAYALNKHSSVHTKPADQTFRLTQ